MEHTMANSPSTTGGNRAIGYTRVSTLEQDEDGLSPEMQEESIRKYAEKHGLEIIGVIHETKPASKVNSKEPISDYDINKILKERPKFANILARGVANEFDHLIVYTRDRIARNTGLFLAVNAYLNKKVQIHYSRDGENLDLNNENYTRLFEVILASFAELEANVISHRVKAGSKACVTNGCKPGGKVAFGFRKVYTPGKKNKFTIEADEDQMEIVREIFNLYCDYGYSYPKIEEVLKENHRDLNLKRSTIQSILQNEQYKGYLMWDRRGGRRNPGKHNEYMKIKLEHNDSYIDDTIWNNATQVYEKKKQAKDPKYFTTPFLLKGKLICGICNQPMVTRCNHDSKVYRCKKFNGCQSELILSQPKLDLKFMEELPKLFTIESVDHLWNVYCNKYEKQNLKNLELVSNISLYISEYADKIRKLNALLEFNLDQRIAEPVQELYVQYKKYMESLVKRKEQIERQPKMLSYERFINRIKGIANNLDQLEPNQRRVFIDKIVDKVIANKQDKIPTMEIHLNISKIL